MFKIGRSLNKCSSITECISFGCLCAVPVAVLLSYCELAYSRGQITVYCPPFSSTIVVQCERCDRSSKIPWSVVRNTCIISNGQNCLQQLQLMYSSMMLLGLECHSLPIPVPRL